MPKRKSVYSCQNFPKRMNDQDRYIKFGLSCLKYKSKQDLYENLYLKALVESYHRIDKSPAIENKIRDRFILDLENKNTLTSELVKKGILQIDFERQHFVSENEKRRTDLVFFISGFGNFIIECKRLFKDESKNNEYITNGLDRFIQLKYSKDTHYAAMSGFIINGDKEIIKRLLLEKCHAINFIENEFTGNIYKNWKDSFRTTHIRSDNSQINIYHLFFEFTTS